MFNPAHREESDPFLAELIQFSSKAVVQKFARHLSPGSARETLPQRKTGKKEPEVLLPEPERPSDSADFKPFDVYSAHAAPLSPLRERDIKAMTELFGQENIHEIEADVIRSLLSRWPEPCWEEDLEFLQDYL